MKKSFLLISSVFLFYSCTLWAQEAPVDYFPNDPEKIYLFDVTLEVRPDTSVQVTENITLNVKGEKIRRGIYRDIPLSRGEKVTPVSLTMDGEKHPFFTEKNNHNLRINFGNNNYIDRGVHTYTFVYTFTNAIRFHWKYDELYWNVTGNYWNFPIDKARVSVQFPSNVEVMKEGISVYTGPSGSKNSDAYQSSPLVFETTKPLASREGFTIAIPFEKGAILEPTWMERLQKAWNWQTGTSVVLLILLFLYCVITWCKVGKDPYILPLVEYDPPKGVSPAFLEYLKTEQVTHQTIACAILNLVMKGCITIEQDEKVWPAKTTFFFHPEQVKDLSPEEDYIISRLFTHSNFCSFSRINKTITLQLEDIHKDMTERFKQNIKPYVIGNKAYVMVARILVLLLGIIPVLFLLNDQLFIFLAFVNIHCFIMMSSFGTAGSGKKLPTKIAQLIFFTIFYSVFWFGAGVFRSPDLLLCQAIFVLGMWGCAVYASLIPNITFLGQELFSHIVGFEKYIKTAEIYRVEASNPIDEERIFCNYLPFAFALGLENEWMRKFTNLLSKSTLDKHFSKMGGLKKMTRTLPSMVRSNMPSSRSGSFGGGCSGGGHGGGGGGGR